jgi:hypothetical protein
VYDHVSGYTQPSNRQQARFCSLTEGAGCVCAGGQLGARELLLIGVTSRCSLMQPVNIIMHCMVFCDVSPDRGHITLFAPDRWGAGFLTEKGLVLGTLGVL